jgi:hypothetical protein
MRTDFRTPLVSRITGSPAVAMSLLLTAGLAASAANAQSPDAAGSAASDTPCLQDLKEEKVKAANAKAKPSKMPKWFRENAEIITGVVGGVGGVALGSKLCKNESAEVRAQCKFYGGLGGAFLGSKLGKMLTEAEQKKYQEAVYTVALTGRPQSLTLEKGCMLVEAESEATYEERQFDLALSPSVAVPQKLRAVGAPHVRSSAASISGSPAAGKGLAKVGANVPLFVMGSTEGGKWLLLGQDQNDPVHTYVGAGYVDAKDWAAAPGVTPSPIAGTGGEPKVVTLGVEVRCTQISNSMRVTANNKQETVSAKTCVLPDGVSDS